LKISSSSLATALLLASSTCAFSFDNQRFYPVNSETIDSSTAGFRLEETHEEDKFALGPSGRIDKISDIQVLNTIGADYSPSGSQNNIRGKHDSNAKQQDRLNIIYSDISRETLPGSECGPSPMTAAEIEVMVERTAQKHGVDPVLAKAIAWAESRFDQNRNSDQGARGAMQLMPSTALELGVRDICDPVSNIDGGVRHLKLMLEKFQNPILAAAAYNAGAQAVYNNGGVPPFPETVRYVATVINHQMGLQMPRQSSARSATTEPTQSDEMASDVIGARGSRFIKGVMQF
jgi:hypothetical protein